MLLKIYDCDGNSHPYTIDSTFFVTESYGGGMSLQWDMSPDHPLYPLIYEEAQVEYENQLYLVKGINERKTIATVNCDVDLTGLQINAWASYKKTTESFYNICREILSGTGWSIVDAELVAPRRSIELTDVTTLDVLNHCTNTTSYGTVYKFDSKSKKIYLVKPQNNTTPTGVYFSDELNLTDLTFKGSTKGLVTRLYPYGKDGLTIASVNGGKTFIDDFSFTDKIVTAIWRDDRYTNPQELLDDAKVKLAASAIPERSYTCKVNDLAKQHPDKYNILSFALYDVVTLIDRKRKTQINHRIVEYKRYPTNANLNTVTLSTIAGTVTGKITAIDNKLTQLDAQQLHDRTKVNEIKQDLDTTVLHISESWAASVNESMFTQTAEGLFLEVNKLVGTNRWSTLLRQSATDVQIAWNNCSNYIKFEQARLNVYDVSNTLQMSLSSMGQSFYYQGDFLGISGTNCWVGNDDIRGIVFDLDVDGSYMTWAAREAAGSNYIMKLAYVAKSFGSYPTADTLYCGCALDMRNHRLRQATLENWAFLGGSISDDFTFEAPLSIRKSDGTVASWKTIKLSFYNGILRTASF